MTNLLLIATIAGQRVAIDASDVEAVVEIEAVSPVPRAAPHVAGLAGLRSRVLTVIDGRAALDMGLSAISAGREAIIVQAEGHAYALLVDTVEDVLEFSGEILPVRGALESRWRRVAVGSVEAGDDLLLLIDVEALIGGPHAQAAHAA